MIDWKGDEEFHRAMNCAPPVSLLKLPAGYVTWNTGPDDVELSPLTGTGLFGKGSATNSLRLAPFCTRPLLRDHPEDMNEFVSCTSRVAVGKGNAVDVVREYDEATDAAGVALARTLQIIEKREERAVQRPG